MSLSKKVELCANVAIVVVALLLGVVLVKRHLLPAGGAAPPEPPPPIQQGAKLTALDVDWPKSERTLLLVLSEGCRFCTESADFYRRLGGARAGREDLRLIAVLPQEDSAARAYLDRMGVAVDEVKQVALGRVGVRGTPTLIMVDGSGSVEASWVGKLPAEKESEVLARFQAGRPAG